MSNINAASKKTACPVTRAEFHQNAKHITVVFEGVPAVLLPQDFKTGSLGWMHNGKVAIKVGDKMVTCQIGLNITVVGSKELPQ